MSDPAYNRAQAIAALQDNSIGSITPQVMRSIEDGELMWTGVWSSTTPYALNDLCMSGGVLYICIAANTGALLTDPTSWTTITSAPVIWPVTMQVVSPTTGSTVTVAGFDLTVIDAGSVLAALTIALPATPTDRQKFSFSTTAAITTLTFSGGTVATLLGLGTTGCATLVYSAAKSKWYRGS